MKPIINNEYSSKENTIFGSVVYIIRPFLHSRLTEYEYLMPGLFCQKKKIIIIKGRKKKRDPVNVMIISWELEINQ